MPERGCEMHKLSLMSSFVYGSALTSVIMWVKCDVVITQISIFTNNRAGKVLKSV